MKQWALWSIPHLWSFLDSQPVSPTTVPDGPTLHQSIPVGVTDCDEQSVVDEVDEETSDTASVDSRNGMSDFEGPVPSLAPVDPEVPAITPQLESFTASFEWLASVDMEFLFTQRACLMKSIPGFMKGAYRSAIRIALTEIDEGRTRNAILRTSRGWKLFLLIPRLLLHRPPRGGKIPKAQLQRRIESFSRDEWGSLLASAQESTSRGAQAFSPKATRCP